MLLIHTYISRLLVGKNNVYFPLLRQISVSTARPVKEVVEHRDGKILTIDAVVKESNRFNRLFDPGHKNGACPLCALGLDVKHTDVLILQQFMRKNGGVLPRRITGLCGWQQRKVGFMVAMAIQAGLMPDYGIAGAMLSSYWFPRFRRYNAYYDENTIKPSKAANGRKYQKRLDFAAQLALAEELQ